ncbi:MAG: YihA family ribosome biogenesis GTP-binding protein [Clostridia bacterium]|nr:YihA family ribosome biogenesis GTP-binding protein [Clostridia bacterium]
MNIQNSSLGLTAGLVSQFPRDSRPQIVFSGRSNVGKSSLINTLLGRKNLARVSSAPGKTITVNFYDIDKKLWFVDIPGYGYAKRDFKDKKRWSALTDNFLSSPAQKRLILQLIDMKVGPTEDDYMMLDWLDESETPYVIVATKCDKLNKTDFNANKEELSKLGPVIPFSSLKGIGKDELWKTLFEFLEN